MSVVENLNPLDHGKVVDTSYTPFHNGPAMLEQPLNFNPSSTNDNAALVSKGALPDVTFVSADRSDVKRPDIKSVAPKTAESGTTADKQLEPNKSDAQKIGEMWYDKIGRIGKDIVEGGVDEVVHNPLKVLASAAIGAGAALLIGVLAPEIAFAAGAAAIVLGAKELIEKVPGFVKSADVVANPEDHSNAELKDAHANLHGAGAGGVDLAAGFVGGIAANAAKAAFTRAAVNAVDDVAANVADDAATNLADDAATNAADDAAKNAADNAATNAADDAAIKAAQELADSIAKNQNIFKTNDVTPMQKQFYDVRFEKVTDPAGRKLMTLENPVEGEFVPQGKWIATRLNPDGTPVIENNMVNSWAMDGAKIAKTYQVTPQELETAAQLVAPTRVGGPPVHMVQLTGPTTITTPWGQMTGKAGDWLANYDYNAALGQPGQDFAIVTAQSFAQTYMPVGS